ncbi:MAG: amidohydrolase family protein, partial [Pseudomonadales bacterium]|nr:amidohydrolase family protein [Pseudomonadales bacterium]
MTEIHSGNLAHVTGNPFENEEALQLISAGALVINQAGRIVETGDAAAMVKAYPDATHHDHGSAWLIPGLVDGHIHFPQFDATAALGMQLLDWLSDSIFPAESRFADAAYAVETARDFTRHLLRSGTTCAAVYSSQFIHATRALFHAARNKGPRLIAGMTLMDRGAPDVLFTPAQTAYDLNETLIEEVADDPLLDYAVTPRFALSCSDALLDVCTALVKAHPACRIQTHINENHGEIAATAETFPDAVTYLNVYERSGLVTPRTILAHKRKRTD